MKYKVALNLKENGFKELAFFVSLDGNIMTHMTMSRRDWFMSRFEDHIMFFNFLRHDDVPIGVDTGEELVTVIWMLPYSLRDFLIDKFKESPNVILCHLITDRNLKTLNGSVDLFADSKKIGEITL